MTFRLNLQNDYNFSDIPDFCMIEKWVAVALTGKTLETELTIRLVDEAEITTLNKTFRGKKCATNVLAFTYNDEESKLDDYLGDIAICAPIVAKEAEQQNKSLQAHWAHLIIHGTLHLLGYDHNEGSDAIEMENLEITLLKSLGFENPYIEEA